jgi:3',5'-nucleoside bisphosphate phosphatase
MLKEFRADLHIHTCLSPCGSLKMSPSNIIKEAHNQKLDIIGICDHNSAENVTAVTKAAQETNVTVLPGVEVTSREEVHLLALFDRISAALHLQEIIFNHLEGENDENTFGMQVVVNAKGEVLGFNPRLLIGATSLSIEALISHIHQLKGLVIAAHVNRESFSLISQLGFIPPEMRLDALEVSSDMPIQKAQKIYPSKFPIVCFSDAHFPEDIGKASTVFRLQTGSIQEITKALQKQEGRDIVH